MSSKEEMVMYSYTFMALLVLGVIIFMAGIMIVREPGQSLQSEARQPRLGCWIFCIFWLRKSDFYAYLVLKWVGVQRGRL
ncbi:MAG: hypothetical protein R8K48_09225 [Gallionella sp.]